MDFLEFYLFYIISKKNVTNNKQIFTKILLNQNLLVLLFDIESLNTYVTHLL